MTMEVDVLIEMDGVANRRERISVDGAMSVGRASYSTLFLDGDLVSRTHALIEINDDGVRVEDTSSNGTRAGEKLLRRTSAVVPYGTPIVVGGYTLYVNPAKRRLVETVATIPAPPPVPGDLGTKLESILPPATRSRLIPPPIVGAFDTVDGPSPESKPSGSDSHPVLTVPNVFDELLEDASVSRIMVIDWQTAFIERAGRRTKSHLRFADDAEVRAAAEQLLARADVRVSRPRREYRARLPDGTRVQVVLSPPATKGTCVTIDKANGAGLGAEQLVAAGALSMPMRNFLERCTKARKNIILSGGAGSGKTSMLRMLGAVVPTDERIVLIEEAPEVDLQQPHVVSLRVSDSAYGDGSELAELVRAGCAMRPDRVLCGDCRGKATLELLHAMTAFDGTMFCLSAASPAEAIARMEAAVRVGGYDMAQSALRELMAASMHLMVHTSSFADGSKRVTEVHEIRGLDERGRLMLHPIYEFEQSGVSASGAVLGEHRSTGYKPSFLAELTAKGLLRAGDAPL